MPRVAHGNRPWAIPTARVILRSDAPIGEWLTTRDLGIGGSDAASLMGESEYDDGTVWHCWATKTKRYRKDLSGAMARGHALESVVLGRLREATGLRTRRAGLMRHHDIPIAQGSVDCLTSDGGIGEAKTTTRNVAAKWDPDGSCPAGWYWQARHYLAVTGKPVVHIAAVTVEDWVLHRWDIERDTVQQDRLLDAEVRFWDTYITPDVAPPFDLAEYTAAEVRDRWPADRPGSTVEAADPVLVMELLAERADLKATVKDAEDALAPIDLALKAMIGDHSELTVRGKVVLTYKAAKPRTVVDHAAALAAHAPHVTDLAPWATTKPGSRSISVKAKPTPAELDQLRRQPAAPIPHPIVLPDVFRTGVPA